MRGRHRQCAHASHDMPPSQERCPSVLAPLLLRGRTTGIPLGRGTARVALGRAARVALGRTARVPLGRTAGVPLGRVSLRRVALRGVPLGWVPLRWVSVRRVAARRAIRVARHAHAQRGSLPGRVCTRGLAVLAAFVLLPLVALDLLPVRAVRARARAHGHA